MLLRRYYSLALPFSTPSPPLPQLLLPWRRRPVSSFPSYLSWFSLSSSPHTAISVLPFSSGNFLASSDSEFTEDFPTKQGPLKPGLYLVGTPIGNLEDITLRALRVLKFADVILSEDTRHSGKLLHYYNVKTPLLSYHKFNESQREQVVLKRLIGGEIVALISDAGMPCISDPGMELAKLCVDKDIPVIPIPGPSAVVAALAASGLPTNQFTFVGFLPKHAATRRERLMVSANNGTTQVFFVPPHKLCQFLEETSPIFGQYRRCVIAREMTKLHEEFWRGTLGEAKEAFSTHQPKGEITLLVGGITISEGETLSESQLENELGELISQGHSLSMVFRKRIGLHFLLDNAQNDWKPNMILMHYGHIWAVKLVAPGTSMRRKAIYSLALEKFGFW